MVFESISLWQAEGFLLKIRAGVFTTREEAAAFVTQPLQLVRQHDRLVFISATTGQAIEHALDHHVTVFKLNDNAEGKTCLTLSDYTEVALSIADFDCHPSLNSFASLSIDVSDISDVYQVHLH